MWGRQERAQPPPGLAELGLSGVLEPLTADPPVAAGFRPSQALRPELRLVSSVWRSSTLLLLDNWLSPARGPMLRVLYGPAGSGKTRAVVVAAEPLQQRQVIGRLRRGAETTSLRPLLKIVQAGYGVLVIVDDAPGRQGLETFLDQAARLGSGRIGVLLVSRHPAWADLFVQRCSLPVQQELGEPDGAGYWRTELDDLVGRSESAKHWQAAHRDFSRRLTTDHPGELPAHLPETSAEIHAHAYLVASGLEPAPNIELALAERERAHWPEPPPGLSARQVRTAVAVLCLLGAEDEIDALTIVASIHGPADVPSGRLMALTRQVQNLYPGAGPGSVAAPQPALLAHALIVPVLAAEPSVRKKLFRELGGTRLAHVLAVLAAAVSDTFPERHSLLTELLRERRLTYEQVLVVLGAVSPSGDRALGLVLAQAKLAGSEIEQLARALGPDAVEAQIELSRHRLDLHRNRRQNTLAARLTLARWLTEAGRIREAIETLQLLLGPDHPEDRRLPQVLALRALLDLRAEKYAQALQWADDALRRMPQRRRLLGDETLADALAIRGQALVRLGEQDAGLIALEEAVAQFGRRRGGRIDARVRSRAWLWLGEELGRRGRTQEASAALNQHRRAV